MSPLPLAARCGFALPSRLLCAMVFSLTLPKMGAAPVITRQPEDVAVGTGQSATFTVAATGTGELRYQWRRHGQLIQGAVEATFVVSGATIASRDFYSVLVTDATGSTESEPADLLVHPTEYPSALTRDDSWDMVPAGAEPGRITHVLSLADEGFYAAGDFVTVNGASRHGVVRFNADGSLDQNFLSVRVSEGGVRRLALQRDGKLLVTGTFVRADGHTRRYLCRFLPDGRLDLEFDAQLAVGEPMVNTVLELSDGSVVIGRDESRAPLQLLDPDGTLRKVLAVVEGVIDGLAIQPDGKFIAVGDFVAVAGGEVREDVARFAADGTLDLTFNLPGEISGRVRCVAVRPEGEVVVGGEFNRIAGKPADGLARFSSTGSIVHIYPAGDLSGVVRRSVDNVVVDTNGRVAAGGNGRYEKDGISVVTTLLEVFDADDEAIDDGFNLPDRPVTTLAFLADGRLLAGGTFQTIHGTRTTDSSTKRQGLVAYTQTGAVDARINVTFGLKGAIHAAALAPGGRLIVGGAFTSVRGTPAFDVVRLLADGSLDPDFDAGTGTSSGAVEAVLALPDGRVAVGGRFSKFAGVARANLAVLRSNGSLDRTFASTSGVLGGIKVLAALAGGRLAAAGGTTFVGDRYLHPVCLYEADGRLVSQPPDRGFNEMVFALAPLPDGRLLVGGNFTAFGGQPRPYLACLQSDGSLDPSFPAGSGPSGPVYDLRLLPDGRILVGGGFFQYNGTTAGYLVRLHPDGLLDEAFQPEVSTSVARIEVQADGGIMLRSNNLNGFAGGGLVTRLDSNGAADPAFKSSGLTSATARSSFVQLDTGQLAMADEVAGLVVTTDAAPPRIVVAPAPAVVALGDSVRLSVAVASPSPPEYQWFHDDDVIGGATAASYTIDSFGASDAGRYRVEITNNFGTVTSEPITVLPPRSQRGRLTNLALRGLAGSNADTLIVGVVVGGDDTSGPKPLLIRGVGPTLASRFDMAGALANPRLDLFNAANELIDGNDDWSGVFDFAAVGAFPLDGPVVRDAAWYNPTTGKGAYTIHVRSIDGTVGIAMAEIYDAGSADAFTGISPRLLNLSGRARVGTGADVLIAGLVTSGTTPLRLLVRAAGPALTPPPYNVAGALADPELHIFDAAGREIAVNRDWEDETGVEIAAASAAVGAFAFPAGGRDAALILTIPPGAYTVHVQGTNGATGVALVEIYEIPE